MKRLFPLIAWMAYLLLAGGCPQADLTGQTGLSGDTTLTGRPADGTGSTAGSSTGDTGSPQGASAATADCAAPANADTWKLQVLQLVNFERSKHGLPTLVWSDTLETEAAGYACELVNDNFFAHVNPNTGETLRDRAAAADYEFQVIGENLAAGQQSPESAMHDWMNSPDHRDNILHPDFTELGVAVRLGGDYGIVWVQEFGVPAAK